MSGHDDNAQMIGDVKQGEIRQAAEKLTDLLRRTKGIEHHTVAHLADVAEMLDVWMVPTGCEYRNQQGIDDLLSAEAEDPTPDEIAALPGSHFDRFISKRRSERAEVQAELDREAADAAEPTHEDDGNE